MTALVVVEAAAIVLLGLLVVGLLRSHAEILRQLHDLGAGREDGDDASAGEDRSGPWLELGPTRAAATPGHDVAGRTYDDEAVMVGVVGAEHDTLLAFLSSGCLTCAGFWEAIGDGPELDLPTPARVVVVTKDAGEESESAIAELAPPGATVVMSSQGWRDYEVPGSPYFVHVEGPTGRVVGEGTALTWAQVADLVKRATSDRSRARDRAGRPPAVGGDDGGEGRVDRELLAAGIHPGHQSLYPDPDQGDEG